MMIRNPPERAAKDNGLPVRSQSTMATRKMVNNAATDESTGEVKEIKTRNAPENARKQSVLAPTQKQNSGGFHLLALATTEIRSIHAASPVGHRNVSKPSQCKMGRGNHRTSKVKLPIKLPTVFAKIMLRPGLVPSGGQASFLYSTSYKPYKTLPTPITMFPSMRLSAVFWPSSPASGPESP